MVKFIKYFLGFAACLFAFSRPGLADSLIVGTDLAHASNGGAVLCAQSSNCSLRAQQFTLNSAVVIDDVKISLSAPGPSAYSDGNFTLSLGNAFPNQVSIGAGDFIFDPNQNRTSSIFDFSNLDIPLNAGTYYLQVSGGNLGWNYGSRVATTAGAFGNIYSCDPSINCFPSRPDILDNSFAADISGTAVTPEPSSIVFSLTGLLFLWGIAWQSLRRVRARQAEYANR